MAIGPIGRSGANFVPRTVQPAGKAEPPAKPPVDQAQRQDEGKVEKSALETAPFPQTYTEIRINNADRVSVRVVNADNDEVILQAPPAGLSGLLDSLPPPGA